MTPTFPDSSSVTVLGPGANALNTSGIESATPPKVRSCIRTTLLPRNQARALLSAARCSIGAVRVLIRNGADIDARDTEGHTALALATYLGNLDAAKRLKHNGASINNCRGESRETPLMIASRIGHLALVKKLIRWGADTNLKNHVGWTALNVAKDGEKACNDWMRDQGVRSGNWHVLFDLAQRLQAIIPALALDAVAPCATQLHATFGLLLWIMPQLLTTWTSRPQTIITDTCSQREALRNAGKAMFDRINKRTLHELTELCLAHSSMDLSTNGLARALNNQAAFLPPLAQLLADCWKAALDEAFADLGYDGRIADFPAFLQLRMPPLFVRNLHRSLPGHPWPDWPCLPDDVATVVAHWMLEGQEGILRQRCDEYTQPPHPTHGTTARLPAVADAPEVATLTTTQSPSPPLTLGRPAPVNTRGDTSISSAYPSSSASPSSQPGANSS